MIGSRSSTIAEPDSHPAKALQLSALDYHVFVDLSGEPLGERNIAQYFEALMGDAGLSAPTTVAVCDQQKLPVGKPKQKIIRAAAHQAPAALHRTIRQAARLGQHLVVVLGPLLPPNEALWRLIEEFRRDPLFGMAQPRFADAFTDQVFRLPGDGPEQDQGATLSRVSLSLLPDSVITPEILSACVVFRSEVVREMDESGSGLVSIAAELRLLLCQARRRGFRNLVVNRVAISTQLPRDRVYPSLTPEDADRLRAIYPDIAIADTACANLAQQRLENVLAGARANGTRERRPRLLLDCRGMSNHHNGTSHSMLGLLDGFHRIDDHWHIDVMASKLAIDFFRMRKRFPKFSLLPELPKHTYTAAILLNQPWALSTISELHRHALLIGFNMLDTISWDIMFVCEERLDAVWRFIAHYADALFYDSRFTRERFANRFPLHAEVTEQVAYLSLAREEQIDQDALREEQGDHILLFGNEYDHKDVRRTAQLLVEACPYAKVVAIGIGGDGLRNVSAMPSGAIEHKVLHRLIATARVIVFPSFYEGFGMPVVQGLAYGRTVVARKSPLWDEISSQVRMPGQLVQFDSTASLVEAVGRTLAGEPLDALPQGQALRDGQFPLRWQDCAQRMIDVLDELWPPSDARRWLEREEALRAIEFLHV